MKKSIATGMLAAFVMFSGAKVITAQETADNTAGLSVNVSSIFNIALSKNALSLGNVTTAGDSGYDEFLVTVNSNHNAEWYLQIMADPILHNDTTLSPRPEIDRALLKYRLNFDYPGQEFPDALTFGPIPTAFSTFYVADGTEYSVNGGQYGVGFVLNAVAPTQQSGPYSTTIHVKMADPV